MAKVNQCPYCDRSVVGREFRPECRIARLEILLYAIQTTLLSVLLTRYPSLLPKESLLKGWKQKPQRSGGGKNSTGNPKRVWERTVEICFEGSPQQSPRGIWEITSKLRPTYLLNPFPISSQPTPLRWLFSFCYLGAQLPSGI